MRKDKYASYTKEELAWACGCIDELPHKVSG